MEQLVRFFFKHEWVVFSKGRLSFGYHPSPIFILLVAAILAAILYRWYAPRQRVGNRARIGMLALRLGFFALLFILIMQPVMVVPAVIPKSTSVAVLIDNSRSMGLADAGKSTRLDAVKNLLGPTSATRQNLEDKFRIVTYGFSNTATKLDNLNELQGQGETTDLAAALGEVIKNSSGTPLSGIVVISDGAVNAPSDLAARLRELKTRDLPVYTVGLGSPANAAGELKDAEMVRVTVPRRILVGSMVNAEAVIRLTGYKSTKGILQVSEDGHAIKTQQFDITGNETRSLDVDFTPSSPGIHHYSFGITPLDGELTTENNQQEAIIQVTDDQPKVLYIEGEPRWEYGKIRHALARLEKNLVLVSVVRSADGKFYRQGVTGAEELVTGFPKTEEELFSYQGVILGSIEANFFSFDQLKSLEKFVAQRGGGFLALGGTHSFAAGNYVNTPVADLLPLYLGAKPSQAQAEESSNYKAALAPHAQSHPITRLTEDHDANLKTWEAMPAITVPEPLTGLKPGASVLLEARSLKNRGSAVPLLVEERYGRGRTMAFTASDTWRWRMELEWKNTSQETFWRQMMRYLVNSTPGPVEVSAERDIYDQGEAVHLHAEVSDKKFEPIKDAQASLHVTSPSGKAIDLPLKFAAGQEADNYLGDFTPTENGLYQVEVKANRAGASLGMAQSSFLVANLNREYHDVGQNVDLLKRVAAETGGKYYTLNDTAKLANDMAYRDGNNSERVSMELWDMPINFMLLIGLISGEWFLRKRKGLA